MNSIDILVETVAGSREKFNYHPATGFFRFKKALPYGMTFPFDFGCIPHTLAEDGDALDAMVISEFKTFTGCVIECRVIGCVQAEQTEPGTPAFRNDRLMVVPTESLVYKTVEQLEDLPRRLMDEVQEFFVQYNKVEGKFFQIKGWLNAEKARKAIEKGKQAYNNKHS